MVQVYNVAYRKEINGEKVPSEEKLFSIYEQHTDIIVKGQREVLFGHKVNLAAGKSNLVRIVRFCRATRRTNHCINKPLTGLFKIMRSFRGTVLPMENTPVWQTLSMPRKRAL